MIIRRFAYSRLCPHSLFATLAVPASGQNLSNPAALREQAPPVYKAKFDTTKGVFVIEVQPRLGAERRRPLLQSGEERLLRQCPLLPRDQRLHGAVRHPRRSEGLGAVARGAAQGRSGQAEQQARLHHLRDGRPEHPHQPGVHQLRRQRQPRQPGLLAVRPRRLRHGGGGQAQRRIRRRRAARPRPRPEPHADGRQRLPDEGFRQARLRQEGDDREDSAWDEAMRRGFCLGLLLAAADAVAAAGIGRRRSWCAARSAQHHGGHPAGAARLLAMAAGERGPLRHGVDGAGFASSGTARFSAPASPIRPPASPPRSVRSITARCWRRSAAVRRCRCPQASARRLRAGRSYSISTIHGNNERHECHG